MFNVNIFQSLIPRDCHVFTRSIHANATSTSRVSSIVVTEPIFLCKRTSVGNIELREQLTYLIPRWVRITNVWNKIKAYRRSACTVWIYDIHSVDLRMQCISIVRKSFARGTFITRTPTEPRNNFSQEYRRLPTPSPLPLKKKKRNKTFAMQAYEFRD